MAWASDLPLRLLRRRRRSRSRSSATRRSTDRERPSTDYQVVSPTYFSTLDLPIVAGRAFDRRDTRDGVPVCIVNEAFARHVSRAVADWPARGAAAGCRRRKRSRSSARSSASRGRSRGGRTRPTDFVQVYVPMAQDLLGRHLPGRPAEVRARRKRWRRRSAPPSRAWTRSSWSACGA